MLTAPCPHPTAPSSLQGLPGPAGLPRNHHVNALHAGKCDDIRGHHGPGETETLTVDTPTPIVRPDVELDLPAILAAVHDPSTPTERADAERLARRRHEMTVASHLVGGPPPWSQLHPDDRAAATGDALPWLRAARSIGLAR